MLRRRSLSSAVPAAVPFNTHVQAELTGNSHAGWFRSGRAFLKNNRKMRSRIERDISCRMGVDNLTVTIQ